MVNHDESESLLDKLILQIFEDQEDRFSFPLTTMKETRDFVRLLNRQGFTYEMISTEIDEQFEAFRSWRLGGGPDAIGRQTMMRINKPLQEAMLSDGDDEDDEAPTSGASSARRKKSMDGGGGRRGSKVGVGKKGKGKDAKDVLDKGVAKVDSEKKGQVEGQECTETARSEKVDKKDGKNEQDACDKHSKLKNDVKLPGGGNSEVAKVAVERDATAKDNTSTVVATAKDATPKNSIKTDKDNTSKTDGNETVKEATTKNDTSKEHEKATDAKKVREADAGKKELLTSTERKELEADAETKRKSTAEPEPKSPSANASKGHSEEKPESTKENGATKSEQRLSTANKKADDKRAEKPTAAILTPPSTSKTPTKPPEASLQKSPPEEGPGNPDQATTSSPTQSSKQAPISPTSSAHFKPGPPSTDPRQIPQLQTPSDKNKNTTDNLLNAEIPRKLPETVCAPTKETSNNAGASLAEQKSDAAKLNENPARQNNSKTDKQIDGPGTKILPVCKISSPDGNDKVVPKIPERETTAPSTLTAERQPLMAKPANAKSETVAPKTDEPPLRVTRTSTDSAAPFCPAPASPKPDPPATKVPPSDATLPAVNENYDSDLDSETADRSAEDQLLIDRLRSLKRNATADGPGHLFVFSDTPAATGTGKHRVRVGTSRFPEKRLQQAQLFNPDIRMVTSVAVATRKDALCRAQEELKSMSLRGQRGWYWGSLDVILDVVTNFSVKEDASE